MAERWRSSKELSLIWRREPDLGSILLVLITRALFGQEDVPRKLSAIPGKADPSQAASLRQGYLDSFGLCKGITFGGSLMLSLGMLVLFGLGIIQIVQGLAGLGWAFLGAGVLGFLLLVAAVYYMLTHGRMTFEGKKLYHYLQGLE